MQHKCSQHKWDHFLRNYETNVLDLGGEGGGTHIHTHDDIFFVKPTEEEKEKHFHII